MRKIATKGNEFNPAFCPVESGIDLMAGKWKGRIMWKLHHYQDTMRFGELRRALGNITDRMLSQQLRELESVQIIERKIYSEVPPKVEYSLTEFGKSMCPILDKFSEWGLAKADEIEAIVRKQNGSDRD